MLFKNLEEIKQCAKPNIDFYTNSICYFFSVRLVYIIRNSAVTPDMLTVMSFFTVLAGAAFLTMYQGYAVMAAAAVLFQISYVLDCADGQLARYRSSFSFFGWRMDLYSDRIKELIIFISLGWLITFTHEESGFYWVLVTAIIGTLNFRKYIDLQEMIKGSEFVGEGGNTAPFSPQLIRNGRNLIRKLEAVKNRFNLGFLNIGEFYFLLFWGLVFDRVTSLLWIYICYGLAVVIYQVYKHMIYAAERSLAAQRIKKGDSEVIIFGLGALGKKLLYNLLNHDVKIAALADNDRKKWDSNLAGIKVISPSNIKAVCPDAVILVASYWSGEIEEQLLEMGISGENIFHIS